MRSLVFCYAAADADLARRIGAFLEVNLPVKAYYEEGVVQPGRDLIEAMARALSADIAVVLLSPEAVVKQWDRSRWEPVFLEQPRENRVCAIFALARDCHFPALLKRQAFADLSVDQLAGMRAIKRLILKHSPAVRNTFDLPPLTGEASDATLESLRAGVVDCPAALFDVARQAALHLAHASKDDFEGAFWIDCSERTPAGILGEIGHSLNLPLSGSPGQNEAALRQFATARRCLFLYEHLAPEHRALIDFGGLFSVIAIAPGPARDRLTLPEIAQMFAKWPQHSAKCLTHLGDAEHHLRNGATGVGENLLALLKNQERLAEAAEVLELLISDATARGDSDALVRYTWDRSWIWGHWGEPYNATAPPPEPVRTIFQIGFDFT